LGVNPENTARGLENTHQGLELRQSKIGLRGLPARATRAVERAAPVDNENRSTGADADDRSKFPTADQAIDKTVVAAQPAPAPAERQFVNRVEVQALGGVEISPRVFHVAVRVPH